MFVRSFSPIDHRSNKEKKTHRHSLFCSMCHAALSNQKRTNERERKRSYVLFLTSSVFFFIRSKLSTKMPFTKKQQIRGIRIMLTVFYGFLLSNTIFRYFVHGIVETVRSPRNIYAIGMIVIGAVILISMILATHATW